MIKTIFTFLKYSHYENKQRHPVFYANEFSIHRSYQWLHFPATVNPDKIKPAGFHLRKVINDGYSDQKTNYSLKTPAHTENEKIK